MRTVITGLLILLFSGIVGYFTGGMSPQSFLELWLGFLSLVTMIMGIAVTAIGLIHMSDK